MRFKNIIEDQDSILSFNTTYTYLKGLPGWLSGKESACNAGKARDP